MTLTYHWITNTPSAIKELQATCKAMNLTPEENAKPLLYRRTLASDRAHEITALTRKSHETEMYLKSSAEVTF